MENLNPSPMSITEIENELLLKSYLGAYFDNEAQELKARLRELQAEKMFKL